MNAATRPLLEVVGSDLQVPVVPSGTRRLVHLDYAASAPALRAVVDRVTEFLPWYASVHRGAGFNSTVSSEALESARSDVAQFVGARRDDVVVFTRNTTDAINLLANVVPRDTAVLTFDLEHHANLLPWRHHTVRHLPTPQSASALVDVVTDTLDGWRGRPPVVALTGASNVTGELLPLDAVVAVAHRAGARVVLDAAQLAPHRRIDLAASGVDYVAFSGHKLYAPFGAGVLVGRGDWLDAGRPYLAGGGAVHSVTLEDVVWQLAPARHEAGTPNVVGAVAIAAACEALSEVGLDAVADHDAALLDRLERGLASVDVPGLRPLRIFNDADRVGIVALAVSDAAAIAAVLSAEYGIATRDGAFCAHPLMRRLGGVDDAAPVPNALRVSVGVGTTVADIDQFVAAVAEVAPRSSRAGYEVVGGRLVPSNDSRRRPTWRPPVHSTPRPVPGRRHIEPADRPLGRHRTTGVPMSSSHTPTYASPVDTDRYGEYRIVQEASDPRPLYRFEGRISTDGSTPFHAEPGRYHIYSGWFCPWAQRVVITRSLAGLDDLVSLSYVDGRRDGRGWAFREPNGPDPVNGFTLLRDAYEATEPGFDGHVSVPTLWDRATGTVASNQFRTIGIDLATQFRGLATPVVDTYPAHLADAIEDLDRWIGPAVNHGVRAAAGQGAEAVDARARLLDAFLDLDRRLKDSRYLLGDTITQADIRLWVTLVRFDVTSNADRAIVDGLHVFPSLWAYARDLYQVPAFRSSTDLLAFSEPGASVPAWHEPTDRATLSQEVAA